MARISVNLFALTGFGNEALKTLLKLKIPVKRLYTRKETGEFPYYREKQLSALAQENLVPVSYVPRQGDWEVKEPATLNIVSTFHRILKPKHLGRAELSLNIHPSLLPSYRGPTPTNWMIYNREKEGGLTVHLMTASIDAGDLIYQNACRLHCHTDAQLRRFLAKMVPGAIEHIIKKYPEYIYLKSPYPSSYQESFYKFFPEKKR